MTSAKKRSALKKAIANSGKGGPGIAGRIGSAIKNVLSAPGRLVDDAKVAYYNHKDAEANRDYDIIKKASASKGAPQFDQNGNPTDAFKYQTAADAIRQKRGFLTK